MTKYIRAGFLALSLLVMPLTLSASAQTGQSSPGGSGYGSGQSGDSATGQGQGYSAAGYDRHQGNNWGWLGLLGLLGLVGLFRRPSTRTEFPHQEMAGNQRIAGNVR